MRSVVLSGFRSLRVSVVGKIFPSYVDFREYELKDEDFQGPNYLAVRAARADLIALLS